MTWQTDILAALSAPTSANNVSKMTAWNACEGNANGRSGLPINNPFNTTLVYGGGTSVNSAGVKSYPSWQTGVQATVRTLASSRYQGVVTNLRNDGTGQQFATAVGNSGWGTSGSCIAGALGKAPTSVQPGGGSTTVNPANVQFTYAQLEGIWIQAGGNPQAAPIAAAVAMAESGGHSGATNTNTNGSVDRGLWQINSVHGSQSTFDIMGNARAAVAISNNGTTWSPWVTYTTGAYQKYMQTGVPPDMNVPINGTNAGLTSDQGGSNQAATLESCSTVEWFISPGICATAGAAGSLNPLHIIEAVVGYVVNPMIQIVAGVMGITGGVVLMAGGSFLIIRQTKTYQAAAGGAQNMSDLFSSFTPPPEQTSSNPRQATGRSAAPQQGARQATTAQTLRTEAARYGKVAAEA